jgi:hypothetical protein
MPRTVTAIIIRATTESERELETALKQEPRGFPSGFAPGRKEPRNPASTIEVIKGRLRAGQSWPQAPCPLQAAGAGPDVPARRTETYTNVIARAGIGRGAC